MRDPMEARARHLADHFAALNFLPFPSWMEVKTLVTTNTTKKQIWEGRGGGSKTPLPENRL